MKRHWFFNFIILQMLLASFIALGFWMMQGSFAGASALLGGVIGSLPALFFTPLFLKRLQNTNARATLGAFYLAEGLKLFISLVLFTLAFQWSKLNPLALFVTFIATQMVYWLIPLLTRREL
jgi:ATP synthase protein I